jgi:hypothetical protein
MVQNGDGSINIEAGATTSARLPSPLAQLQEDTFRYFTEEVNPANGLVADSTKQDSPCSIAAVGLGLACYPVGVERGWLSREEGARRTLTPLDFFWNSEQSTAAEATGYNGFYYHFLDMNSGQRVWRSELSTIDSTFLIAGALAAAVYFDGDLAAECEIRRLADVLYRRVDWQWARNGGRTVTHGWRPESGFLPYRWEGYDEALLLYILGTGSPTYPLPTDSYEAWFQSYRWENLYSYELLYAGPLFIHQLSHLWIDFRGIQDEPMREKGIDYFENSRRATLMQQAYAIDNPHGYAGYGEKCWGITASEPRPGNPSA